MRYIVSTTISMLNINTGKGLEEFFNVFNAYLEETNPHVTKVVLGLQEDSHSASQLLQLPNPAETQCHP